MVDKVEGHSCENYSDCTLHPGGLEAALMMNNVFPDFPFCIMDLSLSKSPRPFPS